MLLSATPPTTDTDARQVAEYAIDQLKGKLTTGKTFATALIRPLQRERVWADAFTNKIEQSLILSGVRVLATSATDEAFASANADLVLRGEIDMIEQFPLKFYTVELKLTNAEGRAVWIGDKKIRKSGGCK